MVEKFGRAIGGAARALALTSEKRKEISQKGVQAKKIKAAAEESKQAKLPIFSNQKDQSN